mgnify:CR=1 FL=1
MYFIGKLNPDRFFKSVGVFYALMAFKNIYECGYNLKKIKIEEEEVAACCNKIN